MSYRVGRWTTGISLVLFGFMILLSQISDFDGFALVGKLWPLVLIGYGLEYLLYARREEKLKFDTLGAILVTIAFVGVIGFNIFGGFGFLGPKYTFQDEPIIQSSEGITLINATTKNGKVTVQPSTDQQIQIIATYRIPAFDEQQALAKKEKLRLDIKQQGTNLNAEVVYPSKSWIGGMNESVDLAIFLPREIAVALKTSNGSIEISGMENVVHAKTSNGKITVVDSKGEHTVLDTSNGRIEVDRFVGSLKADTSNGKIIVTQGEVTGDWSLHTSNGAIEAEIQENGSYDYYFSTSNGKVNVPNPPFMSQSDSKKKIQGSVNGGKIKLDFRTSNGSITVHTR